MFQPKGFSRPDSWGYPFLPPKNEDDAIEYVDEGKSLILPNTLMITRNRDVNIEHMLDNSHYKHTGGKMNTNEMESYVDVSLGRIIFNRTNIPRNTCQEFRSVARIESGGLYHSKIDSYAIFQYYRDGERIAVTLSQNTGFVGGSSLGLESPIYMLQL